MFAAADAKLQQLKRWAQDLSQDCSELSSISGPDPSKMQDTAMYLANHQRNTLNAIQAVVTAIDAAKKVLASGASSSKQQQ